MAGSLAMEQITYRLLRTQPTEWEPASVKVALNVLLDGGIVPSPSSPAGARVDAAHLVVLDAFLDEPLRAGLAELLLGPGWPGGPAPPTERWELTTCDGAVGMMGDAMGMGQATWGLKDEVLEDLHKADCSAVREVHARLCRLYPEYDIAYMPAEHIQAQQEEGAVCASDGGQQERVHQPVEQPQLSLQNDGCWAVHSAALAAGSGRPEPPTPGLHAPGPRGSARTGSTGAANAGAGSCCHVFVGNAAVAGDQYSWHMDADPSGFPESPWTQQHGHYVNREPGKPLFVSLLLYLDAEWKRDWDAETLFLDVASDVGILVRPKAYRAVLMDQDVVHRLSPPSLTARRPRFSLVWKLVFLPRRGGATHEAPCIARASWGRPVPFASAARVQAVMRQITSSGGNMGGASGSGGDDSSNVRKRACSSVT